MTSSLSWFRSWHGAPMDNKYMVIATKANVKVGVVSAIMWALLDYASQNQERGSVDGFDTETYAAFTGFDEKEIIAVMEAMTAKGIITDGRLSNWEKRQPKREDDSRERVTRFRELKRDVTQGNAPEERRGEEIKKEDAEVNAPPPHPSDDPDLDGISYKPLEVAFREKTGIYPPTGGGTPTQKWVDGFKKLMAQKATPEEIAGTIDDMREQGLSIAGPKSILNPLNIYRSKINGKPKVKPKMVPKIDPYGNIEEFPA